MKDEMRNASPVLPRARAENLISSKAFSNGEIDPKRYDDMRIDRVETHETQINCARCRFILFEVFITNKYNIEQLHTHRKLTYTEGMCVCVCVCVQSGCSAR